jgi:hypothetical protein
MRGRKKSTCFYLLAAGGAALFTLLLIRQGAPHVIAAFASAGWWIAVVAIYHLAVPVLLDAIAWWALFPKSERLRCGNCFGCAGSANQSARSCLPLLLAAMSLGRGLRRCMAHRFPTAAASVLVDITLGVFVQIVFTLLGWA